MITPSVRIDDKEDIDALLTAYQMGLIKPIPNNLTVRQRLKLAAPGNVVVVEGLTIYKDGKDWGELPDPINLCSFLCHVFPSFGLTCKPVF